MDEEKYKELLIELLEKNGRVFVITPKGLINTYDRYDGTDGGYFETYEEACEWEKGYQNMVPFKEQ